MSDSAPKEGSDKLNAANYCVSFVDLLGQRDAVRNQRLLPDFETEEQRRQFHSVLQDSIGAILGLQKQAEKMLDQIPESSRISSLRAQLSHEQQTHLDQMQLTRILTQRWSDGLVSFVCLGDQAVKCPTKSIFRIFGMTGLLALLGLARGRPVRGAIEIAWGVELRPGELYGPAVARAYELESTVAEYPRIVVGPQAIEFLKAHQANPEQDLISRFNRLMAERCWGLLLEDVDGCLILHYLGKEFQSSVTNQNHAELYELASRYVQEQLERYRLSGNTKLAFRYRHLANYFEAHAP
jgi:hypothetical protein